MLPGRETEWRRLEHLVLGTRPPLPAVFVTGALGCGKTLTLQTFFTQHTSSSSKNVFHSYTHCLMIQHNQRLLYDRVLEPLHKFVGELDAPAPSSSTSIARPSNAYQFVELLNPLLDRASQLLERPDFCYFIILDHAHHLRSGKHISLLIRLSELTRGRVCVLLLTHVSWDSFREGTGTFEPATLYFKQYTREQLTQIMMNKSEDFILKVEASNDDNNANNAELKRAELRQCYSQLLNLVMSTFNHVSVRISDLEYFMQMLFPIYVQPVLDGRYSASNTKALFDRVQPYLIQRANKLYLRELGGGADSQQHRNQQQDLQIEEYSHLTKYLIIASFLASYNPAKYDMRFFAKSTSRRDKLAKLTSRKQGKKLIGSMMLGPAPFPLDRMLAIFSNIVDEPAQITVGLYQQVASLVSSRVLLSCSTSMERSFDTGLKMKCNVQYDFIKQLAKSVDFDVARYLYDQ